MKGLLGSVVGAMATDVWEPLAASDHAPDELAGEIFRAIASQFDRYRSRSDDLDAVEARATVVSQMAEAIEDSSEALVLLAAIEGGDFSSEAAVVAAVSGVVEIFDDYEDDRLRKTYVDLVRAFIGRYSLRYAVDPSGALWLSWTGMATALFHEVREHAHAEEATRCRFEDFEMALAECVANPRTDKIETVLSKQMNLLEACGVRHPSTTQRTLGRICDELDTWPHEKLKEVAKALYGFASDYPGVRHGGTYEAAHRELDLGDLAAFATSLLGLSVYLNDDIRPSVEFAVMGAGAPLRFRSTVGPSGPMAGGI
jgi:hypothetical protein